MFGIKNQFGGKTRRKNFALSNEIVSRKKYSAKHSTKIKYSSAPKKKSSAPYRRSFRLLLAIQIVFLCSKSFYFLCD